MNISKHIDSFLSNPKFLIILLCLIFIFNGLLSYTQNIPRRHFIIALDNSQSFRRVFNDNEGDIQNALKDLFLNNNPPSHEWLGDRSKLWNSNINRIDLFDKDKDRISFYLFNYFLQDLNLQSGKSSSEFIKEFNSKFIYKTPSLLWTDTKEDITDYFISNFNFGSPSSIDLSKFLYPLILDSLDISDAAEEYILVVITQKRIQPLNDIDFNTLNNILGVSSSASGKSLIEGIKYQINKLNLMYSIPELYFEANKGVGTSMERTISGYRITPKYVLPGSAATTITLNSNITLKQTSHKGDTYEITNFQLNFPDNSFLTPTGITLKVSEQDNSNLLFNDEIIRIKDIDDWESAYSESSRVLNNKNGVYSLNGLKIQLPDLGSEKKPLRIELIIKSKVTDGSINPLNFVFYSNANIPQNNIESYSYIIYLLLRIVPVLLLIILILVVVWYGKPQELKFKIDGYLDSYESINYKKYGKLHTPYKCWDDYVDSIVIDGETIFKSKSFFFNWNPEIYFRIQEEKIPEGFDIFIKPDFESIKEFSKGNLMSIKADNVNKLKFIVCLRQNDINIKIKEPYLIKFAISVLIRETKLFFIKSEINEFIEYQFHIGEDLGDVWVSFDPGTTGSCLAIGNHADNISICLDSYKQKIIDSKLNFNVSEDYLNQNGEIPEYLYEFGTKARTKFGDKTVKSYQSIKKLLGFKDIKEISFKNGGKLYLTGKELSSILVKGLFKELNYFVQKVNNPEFFHNGTFNPRRAVVAIPNNFTISKIQDMIDCLIYLNQFKEIRYIYEAEAVLFYYLSNYSRYNKGSNEFQDENILVFDMGGATINATVVSATKTDHEQGPVYYIDFLGKIGYGIGGDTIDYCILKFIQFFSYEYPQLKAINIYSENKKELVEAARLIKLQIVDYFEKGYDTLITIRQLNDYLKPLIGNIIEFSEESDFYKHFKKDAKGKFQLFSHPIFIDLIYNNVKDAVNEVLELSNCTINKVVFSGRSTFYPNIKETVEKQLKSKNSNPVKISLEIEESKTAVAQGACWYGINKNSIRLNNLKTNASFGVKQTLTTDTSNVEFIELIKIGCQFDSNSSEIDQIIGTKNITANFAFDGGKVNFYQIMGKDANVILSYNQKHKFSKIASIRIPTETLALQMIVKEDDDVECKVKLKNNRLLAEKGVVSDQEIGEANEEHYTWIIN